MNIPQLVTQPTNFRKSCKVRNDLETFTASSEFFLNSWVRPHVPTQQLPLVRIKTCATSLNKAQNANSAFYLAGEARKPSCTKNSSSWP
ncbi:hypothetical protein CEXT_576311 [Caerostris extrusa]|uniref:Uncharacterized protein n=1 Tax=Caerostris extrusa TaxID=172846 RepID=A0AAV4QEZ1_CAEEX|nr:hypothetical protein CEXT_576311 [Caerostris extrusa]